MVFAVFSVVLIKILHPAVVRLTDILPGYTLPIITAVFTLAFLTDSAVTITGFSGFNKRLAAFSETLAEKGRVCNPGTKLGNLRQAQRNLRWLCAQIQLPAASYDPCLPEA